MPTVSGSILGSRPRVGGRLPDGGPMTRHTFVERLALRVLAREGITAIWHLHIAAAQADAGGRPTAAAMLIEIADAAEREWRGGGFRGRLPPPTLAAARKTRTDPHRRKEEKRPPLAHTNAP